MTPATAGVPVAGAALRSLLDGLVDWAGLFPPAALPMRDAVRLYDEYRRGPRAWAFGRFVLPAARLAEFEEHAAALPVAGARWRLSVLAGPADRAAIDAFNVRQGARAEIDAIEGKASTIAEIEALAPFAAAFTTYVEIPTATDPEPLIVAIHAHGLRAKVRTGGVTAEAFPAAAQVVRFLAACAAHDVAFKATAGLHHPLPGDYQLTYETGGPSAAMFGFVNVFIAACLLREGAGEAAATELLAERDATAIAFDADGVRWRDHRVPAVRLGELRRRFATSFGSCSFAEPLDELAALGLL